MNETTQTSDRTWDVFCHLSSLAGLFVPFSNIVGPLVIWLVRKDKSPSVEAHGKESLNFQLSVHSLSLYCSGSHRGIDDRADWVSPVATLDRRRHHPPDRRSHSRHYRRRQSQQR